MKRTLLSLCFINLFFIGLLVGVVFVKQNTKHTILLASPAINYHSLSVTKRVQLYLTELEIAFNLTAHSIIDNWGSLLII